MQRSLLLSLTVEELEDHIQKAVAAGVVAALRQVHEKTPTELLTRSQLATALQCSTRHISDLIGRGLPCMGEGATRRFRLAEVEAWLREQGKHADQHRVPR